MSQEMERTVQRRHEIKKVILQKQNPMRTAEQAETSRRSRVHDLFAVNTISLKDKKTPEAFYGQSWMRKDSIPLARNSDFYSEDN